MKLSHSQVLLLINTINPTVEYYKDVNAERYHQLLELQQQLDDFYSTEICRIKTKNQRIANSMKTMTWKTIK
jgi:hypothetical protein